MGTYRVVLHFSMASKMFKVFYEFLKKEGVRVDGIYKAKSTLHTYYQDYSQILLDFSTNSHEILGKHVLFITSLDQCSEEPSILMDKDIANPDISSLCKRVPLIYGIRGLAKKYGIVFNEVHNCYYEAITLLVPSIQCQSDYRAISVFSLIKAINLLGVERNFLEGIKSHFKSTKMQEAFTIIEIEMFWEKFSQQKKEKDLHKERLKKLEENEYARDAFKCDPMDNNDPAKTFIYMQLVELNSKLKETTINENVKFDVSFSDDEFDKEAQSECSQFRSNIFAIPNARYFESTELECISIEPYLQHFKH